MARLQLDSPADIRLLDTGFSAGQVLSAFARMHRAAGGVASFVGKVRPGDNVKVLQLTHYEPLTLPGMRVLGEQALERFGLDGLLAWHRVGTLRPGAAIVLVAAAARHRRDALQAVEFTMDHLKSKAWFWKRERRGSGKDGAWHWIEPREQDRADLQRWS